MSRAKFDSLPKASQEVIRRYGGKWLAERFVNEDDVYNESVLQGLRSDPRRNVNFPSPSEVEVAAGAFGAIRAEWANANPHSRALLNLMQEELAKYRAER